MVTGEITRRFRREFAGSSEFVNPATPVRLAASSYPRVLRKMASQPAHSSKTSGR